MKRKEKKKRGGGGDKVHAQTKQTSLELRPKATIRPCLKPTSKTTEPREKQTSQ